MGEAIVAVSHFANDPIVRLALAALSVAGFFISLWSLRRTFANTAVEHARFIESQWQSIYHLTLNNEKFAGHVARMFGYGGIEKAEKGAALLMYVNVLASTHHAYTKGLIRSDVYESHMKSFFYYYKGSAPALQEAILLEGYEATFVEECRRFIEEGKAFRAGLNTGAAAFPD